METRIYTIAHLGCANCAAKMEEKINRLDGVEATITFATKQLRVTSEDPDCLLEQMQTIVSSIESDARIVLAEHHHHGESEPHDHCGCDHHHHGDCAQHHEHCECAHHHEHHEHHDHHHHEHSEERVVPLLIGGALFVIGLVLDALKLQVLGVGVSLAAYIAAYLVLGWPVLSTAAGNLIKGRVFDENFLMSLATLGAFVIREFPEAAKISAL